VSLVLAAQQGGRFLGLARPCGSDCILRWSALPGRGTFGAGTVCSPVWAQPGGAASGLTCGGRLLLVAALHLVEHAGCCGFAATHSIAAPAARAEPVLLGELPVLSRFRCLIRGSSRGLRFVLEVVSVRTFGAAVCCRGEIDGRGDVGCLSRPPAGSLSPPAALPLRAGRAHDTRARRLRRNIMNHRSVLDLPLIHLDHTRRYRTSVHKRFMRDRSHRVGHVLIDVVDPGHVGRVVVDDRGCYKRWSL